MVLRFHQIDKILTQLTHEPLCGAMSPGSLTPLPLSHYSLFITCTSILVNIHIESGLVPWPLISHDFTLTEMVSLI